MSDASTALMAVLGQFPAGARINSEHLLAALQTCAEQPLFRRFAWHPHYHTSDYLAGALLALVQGGLLSSDLGQTDVYYVSERLAGAFGQKCFDDLTSEERVLVDTVVEAYPDVVGPNLIARWQDQPKRPYVPEAKYYAAGDFLTYFVTEESCRAHLIANWVTLYRTAGWKAIGFKLDNVTGTVRVLQQYGMRLSPANTCAPLLLAAVACTPGGVLTEEREALMQFGPVPLPDDCPSGELLPIGNKVLQNVGT